VPWKFDLKSPVSQQVSDRLRLEILQGTYGPGQQFPTVRSLAYEASVNPNTVQKALTTLEEEGLLINHGTVGRFVTEDEALIGMRRRELQIQFLDRIAREAEFLGITREDLTRYLIEREERSL